MRRRLTARRMTGGALVLLLVAGCGTTVVTTTDGAPGQARATSGSDSGSGLEVPTDVLTGTGPAPALPGSGTAVAGPAASRGGTAGSSRTGSGPTAPAGPAPAGPAPAGAIRTPVSVGILYTNNDAAASAGIDNGNTFTPRKVFEGLVRAWNSRGGIAGRRVEPVYVELRSSSQSISTDLQAACERFTRDARVALVLSTIGIFFESFARCIAAAGTPLITGDYALGDDESLRGATTYFATSTLTTDARAEVLLEQLVAARRLGPADRLGVVVEGCPFNERTSARTLAPVARRLGLTIADTFVGRCFEGIDDLGGLASDMQNAVLRFATAGVTHVTFVSGGAEGNLMLFFATAAQAQGYRPGYALTSAAVPAVQETNTPREQLANAVGLGWLPSLDSARTASPTTTAEKRCVADLLEGAGATPQSPADRYFAYSVCDTFTLSDAALRRTRGATDLRSVAAAVDALGAGLPTATPYGGATDFSRGRRSGPSTGRLFAWGTGCGCFDYVGPTFGLRTG